MKGFLQLGQGFECIIFFVGDTCNISEVILYRIYCNNQSRIIKSLLQMILKYSFSIATYIPQLLVFPGGVFQGWLPCTKHHWTSYRKPYHQPITLYNIKVKQVKNIVLNFNILFHSIQSYLFLKIT